MNHAKCAACRCSIAWSILAALLISSSARADEEEAWPREIETPQGLVVIYQPQLDRLEGNTLDVRAAVSVAPTGESEPTFGVVWFKAHLDTDFDGRTVVLRDVVVPSVKFQGATPEQQQALVDLLNTEIPKWNLEMSLDRMVALLDLAEKQAQVAEGFDDTPPTILFADYPAVLVAIDGAPSLLNIPNTELRIVINTPFLIMEDLKDQHFYLYAGNESWYDASAIEGPWRVTDRVPARVLEMQPFEKLETEGEIPDEFMSSTVFPKIIVATEATELIVTDGPPRFRPIGNGELSHLSNTESDVLLESATQRYFVLLSGRWFSSESLNGPWVFVASDALPPSFAEIPPDSDQGYLLTWVAGTQLAKDAVLESYIPQTASVPRDVTIKVIYDGAPQFEAIEDTNLEYAVNTQFQVIKSGAMYYCLHEAVWYMASAPSGPWRVASEVPEEIYDIPPSSPLYNTTFVSIYEATPDEVYVGYYPGYVNSYVYNGCVVYGTGWRYRAYVSPRRCYPRHATWGHHMRWNPWHGWGAGSSFSNDNFTFSVGIGGHRGWWGTGGYRGYRPGYHRGWHQGYNAGRRDGVSAGYRVAKRDTARNIYSRSNNRPRTKTAKKKAASTHAPRVSKSRSNNLYTDKNGNVYRRQSNGQWQTRSGGQWKNSRPDSASNANQRQNTGQPRQPSSTPTQYRAPSSLNRDYNARQRGNQRSRSAPSRGGGGRRR